MKLRPHQERGLADLSACYAAGKRAPICVAPTGAGKTVLAAEAIRRTIERGNRALFLVPRIELLNQATATLQRSGLTSIRTIQAQNDIGDPDAPVVVASIPTLTTPRWLDAPVPAEFVVVDEAHHGPARTHQQLLNVYSRSKLLALTATPQRGDGRALQDLFDAIVPCSSVKELTDLGVLVPCTIYAPPRIMDSRELAMDPVDAYARYTPGEKTLVFCATVQHAKQTCEEFISRGISSRWISGDSRDREEIISSFSRREFDVLVNVNVCVEGFDDPPIESAIFAKRFTHVGGYLQAIGRTLRSSPGKLKSKIVDLCGSALVHGTPDAVREYSLEGKGITSKREPIRQCQECGAVFVSASAQACPYCEFKLPALTRAQMKALGIKLEEVSADTKPKTSWPMRSRQYGKCAGCQKPIIPGAWILYSKVERKALHMSCATQAAAAKKAAA
jgi:DNA repair protein RadD